MASCTLALTEYPSAMFDSQVTHIGGMVNRNILSETLLKQKNSFQRRTLPPTLRQVTRQQACHDHRPETRQRACSALNVPLRCRCML